MTSLSTWFYASSTNSTNNHRPQLHHLLQRSLLWMLGAVFGLVVSVTPCHAQWTANNVNYSSASAACQAVVQQNINNAQPPYSNIQFLYMGIYWPDTSPLTPTGYACWVRKLRHKLQSYLHRWSSPDSS